MRMMTKPLALLTSVVTATVLGIGVAAPASAEQGASSASAAIAAATTDTTTNSTRLPVTGTLADGTGLVQGFLDLQKFSGKKGVLTVSAMFTGSVTDAAGHVTPGSQQLTLPVDLSQFASNAVAAQDVQALATCQILNLVLGPLDLNLLGLTVHLDTVRLVINAVSGAGNLLGNLLCAVVGLLDGVGAISGILNGIAALLNRLLALLPA